MYVLYLVMITNNILNSFVVEYDMCELPYD